MRTWRAFLEFQNAMAYPNGVPAGSGRTAELQYMSPPAQGGSLIIGPGGAAEVVAMRPLLPPGPIATLSAHEPEVIAIRETCDPWATPHAGDMHDMPFDDASFDYVFCSNVGEHAASPVAWSFEIRRVLKDAGRFHIILPSFEGVEGGIGPFHWFCMPEHCWRELFRKSGLAIDDVQIEQGRAASNTGYYMHFRGHAGEIPHPSNQLMAMIKELRAAR